GLVEDGAQFRPDLQLFDRGRGREPRRHAPDGVRFADLGRSLPPGAPRASARPRGRGAAVLLGWMFFYELFLEGGAGRLEMLHPGQGLRRFASMMILNSILCAAPSVRASRYFER